MKTLSVALALLGISLCAPSASAQVQVATVECAADVAIYAESGAVANGSGENLFLGANSQGNARRALVRFDVASVLPAGSVVVDVEMTVNVNQSNPSPEPFSARRVLASWVEGPSDPTGSEGQGASASGADVTWTLRDFAAGAAWTTPGGDLAPSSAFAGTLGLVGIGTFLATEAGIADVQSWLDAPSTNAGWALLGNESAPSTAKRLSSRTSTDVPSRPRLAVFYFAPGARPVGFCPANPNSAGTPAVIQSIGSTSVAANAWTLSVSGLPPNASGTFFFGPRDAFATVFGDGLLCVASPFRRLGVQTASAGVVARSIDFTASPTNVLAPGSRAAFQFWYRDALSPTASFNTSDAILVPFFP